MLTLNGAQAAKGREMHLCPLQFDLADRAITQYTMPGEMVLDPFSGIGTVAYRAVLLGRRGMGIELSARYHADAVYYLDQAEAKRKAPALFDFVEEESALGVGA
jgi:DNA modification methylase